MRAAASGSSVSPPRSRSVSAPSAVGETVARWSQPGEPPALSSIGMATDETDGKLVREGHELVDPSDTDHPNKLREGRGQYCRLILGRIERVKVVTSTYGKAIPR